MQQAEGARGKPLQCAGARNDPVDLVDKFNLPEASRRMIRKVPLSELTITGENESDWLTMSLLVLQPRVCGRATSLSKCMQSGKGRHDGTCCCTFHP